MIRIIKQANFAGFIQADIPDYRRVAPLFAFSHSDNQMRLS